MSSARFSPGARADLLEIVEYIRRDRPQAAIRFVARLEEKCTALAAAPDMGFARQDLGDGLRVWPFGQWLIFYRVVANGVEIVRVVHGARDLPRLFDGS